MDWLTLRTTALFVFAIVFALLWEISPRLAVVVLIVFGVGYAATL